MRSPEALAEKLAAKHPEAHVPPPTEAVPAPPANPAGPDILPPPTKPAGPRRPGCGPINTAAGAAAKVLTQQAVVDALGSDVPPRAKPPSGSPSPHLGDRDRWSPGGIFNELPKIDDDTAQDRGAADPSGAREPSPSRTSGRRPPSRNWPPRSASTPRPANWTGSSARCAPGRGAPDRIPVFRLSSGRRFRRWSTSRC